MSGTSGLHAQLAVPKLVKCERTWAAFGHREILKLHCAPTEVGPPGQECGSLPHSGVPPSSSDVVNPQMGSWESSH